MKSLQQIKEVIQNKTKQELSTSKKARLLFIQSLTQEPIWVAFHFV